MAGIRERQRRAGMTYKTREDIQQGQTEIAPIGGIDDGRSPSHSCRHGAEDPQELVHGSEGGVFPFVHRPLPELCQLIGLEDASEEDGTGLIANDDAVVFCRGPVEKQGERDLGEQTDPTESVMTPSTIDPPGSAHGQIRGRIAPVDGNSTRNVQQRGAERGR